MTIFWFTRFDNIPGFISIDCIIQYKTILEKWRLCNSVLDFDLLNLCSVLVCFFDNLEVQQQVLTVLQLSFVVTFKLTYSTLSVLYIRFSIKCILTCNSDLLLHYFENFEFQLQVSTFLKVICYEIDIMRSFLLLFRV